VTYFGHTEWVKTRDRSRYIFCSLFAPILQYNVFASRRNSGNWPPCPSIELAMMCAVWHCITRATPFGRLAPALRDTLHTKCETALQLCTRAFRSAAGLLTIGVNLFPHLIWSSRFPSPPLHFMRSPFLACLSLLLFSRPPYLKRAGKVKAEKQKHLYTATSRILQLYRRCALQSEAPYSLGRRPSPRSRNLACSYT